MRMAVGFRFKVRRVSCDEMTARVTHGCGRMIAKTLEVRAGEGAFSEGAQRVIALDLCNGGQLVPSGKL